MATRLEQNGSIVFVRDTTNIQCTLLYHVPYIHVHVYPNSKMYIRNFQCTCTLYLYFIIPDDDGDHDDNHHDDNDNQDDDDDHDHDDENDHDHDDEDDHDEDEYSLAILFVFLGGVIIFFICIYMVLLVAIGLVLHIKMIQKQKCSKR